METADQSFDYSTGIAATAHFSGAFTIPLHRAPSQFLRRQLNEAAHAFLAAGGDHEILRLFLLQHQPLHFHVIAGVSPVAQ